MQSHLNIALRAARRAASFIQGEFSHLERLQVDEKRSNDFVTDVDRGAEAAIIEVIRDAYPDHSILGEESGALEPADADGEFQWIIDPLDGTSNFIHGIPHFSVSIACLRRGRAEVGLVLDVMRGEEFTALRGRGAMQGGRRLRVSGRNDLRRAVVCTGIPTFGRGHSAELGAAFFACLGELANGCSGLRRTGSAALDLAWVASGRLDAFFEVGLQPWDVAAGALLVQEAGGLVSDFNGGENYMTTRKLACGATDCLRQLLPIVRRHLGEIAIDAQTPQAAPDAPPQQTSPAAGKTAAAHAPQRRQSRKAIPPPQKPPRRPNVENDNQDKDLEDKPKFKFRDKSESKRHPGARGKSGAGRKPNPKSRFKPGAKRDRRPPSKNAPKSGARRDWGSPSKDAPKSDARRDRRSPSKNAPKSGAKRDWGSPSKNAPKSGAKRDRRSPSKNAPKSGAKRDRRSPSKDAPKSGAKRGRRPPSKNAPKSGAKRDRRPPSKNAPKSGAKRDRRPPSKNAPKSGAPRRRPRAGD